MLQTLQLKGKPPMQPKIIQRSILVIAGCWVHDEQDSMHTPGLYAQAGGNRAYFSIPG